MTLVYLMLELGVSLHQHGHELLILGVLLLKLLLDQCCQHVLGGAQWARVRYLGAWRERTVVRKGVGYWSLMIIILSIHRRLIILLLLSTHRIQCWHLSPLILLLLNTGLDWRYSTKVHLFIFDLLIHIIWRNLILIWLLWQELLNLILVLYACWDI